MTVNRAFSSAKKVLFVPRAEGEYEFMVEAVASGRKGVDQQASFAYAVSLSRERYPVESIELTGSVVDEFADGQDISYTVAYSPNENDDAVELQVQYSLNGISFTTLSGYDWQTPSPQTGIESIVSSLPQSSRDRHYFVRINARTVGRTGVDVYAEFEIDAYAVSPLDAIDLNISEPQVQILSDRFDLSASAEREGQPADAEYIFYYRLVGAKRWTAIYPGWNTTGAVSFTPKYEGQYEFRVMAHALGRKGADVSADSETAYGIYITELPVQSISAEITDSDAVYERLDSAMHVTLSVDANEEASSSATEWQVQVSTNGKKYGTLVGYDWQTLTTDGDGVLEKTITLPTSARDMHVWIKINARTAGRTSSDTSVTLEADVLVALPLLGVVLDAPDVSNMVENHTIVLTASAEKMPGAQASAEYMFFYKKVGSSRWTALSRTYSSKANGTGKAIFTPPSEGEYEFMVQARSTGKRTIDATAELEEPCLVYFDIEPTTEVSVDVPQRILNTESIQLGATITPPDGETSEFRLLMSSDKRVWTVVEGYEWTVYNSSVSAELALPEMVGDSTFYVRVDARTVGRYGKDFSRIIAIERYDLIPVRDVALSVETSGDTFVTLLAQADIEAGYEDATEVYYRYYYQLVGSKGWTAFTSWAKAPSTTFTPTISGDYIFRVEAVNWGRNGFDAAAENAGTSGYYLETVADIALIAEESEPLPEVDEDKAEAPEASPEPTSETAEELEPSMAPTPGVSPEPSISPEPSADPLMVEEAKVEEEPTEVTSLAFAQSEAIGAVLGQRVTPEAVMETNTIEQTFGVQRVEIEELRNVDWFAMNQVIVLQLADQVYGVLDFVSVDENGNIIGVLAYDAQGEILLGGFDDVISAWYYVIAEEAPIAVAPEPTPSPEATPNLESEPTPSIEPIPEPAEPEPEPTEEPTSTVEPEPEQATEEAVPGETPTASE